MIKIIYDLFTRSFLLSIFFLFLLFLAEHIFLVNFPQLPILGCVLVETLVAEANIFSRCLGSLMEFPYFGYQHCHRNFEVAQRLLISIQHEKTAAQVIEDCRSVH